MRKVVAAVIEQKGSILLARRQAGSMAGKWEFPGGKVREGEEPEEALVREIREELGLVIEVGEEVGQVPFEVTERALLLVVFRAEVIAGEIALKDHSEVKWVKPQELMLFDLAPADIPVARDLGRNL